MTGTQDLDESCCHSKGSPTVRVWIESPSRSEEGVVARPPESLFMRRATEVVVVSTYLVGDYDMHDREGERHVSIV